MPAVHFFLIMTTSKERVTAWWAERDVVALLTAYLLLNRIRLAYGLAVFDLAVITRALAT